MYVCDRLRACVFTSDLAAAVQTPFHSMKKKKKPAYQLMLTA